MNPEKKCPACEYAVPNPDAPMEQIMRGERQLLCLRNPPVATPMQHGQRIAIVTVYPPVDANTVSCGEWTDRDALQRKRDAWDAALLGVKKTSDEWPAIDSDPSMVGE
jgi:hypothetical protein